MLAVPEQLWAVVLPFLEDLDTPRSLTVKLLIEHGEGGQLAKLRCDPAHYLTAWAYFLDAQATDLLRKCPGLEGAPTKEERRSTAEMAFDDAERRCCETNHRLDRFLHNGPFEGPGDFRIVEFLDTVKMMAEYILGSSVPSEIDGKFGPGATFGDKGGLVTIPQKLASLPTVTESARCLIPIWERTAWSRYLGLSHSDRSEPFTIPGNRFSTVDKDSLVDRGIAVEPSLNVYYQLALGKTMRRKLAKFGIDLDEGQTIHQQKACESSHKGDFATIDLSSASDTISRTLVRLVLPSQWFDVLDMLRSPKTRLITAGLKARKRSVHLQKFSSMGNGFTFELETLVFLCLVSAILIGRGIDPLPGVNVFVYGDDIIVPSECAQDVLSCLRYFGMVPNPRKTFVSGGFRESCGGDYFEGTAVRPYFLKKFPTEPAHWISMANGLRRAFAEHVSFETPYLGPFYRAHQRALSQIPSEIRNLRGPEMLGDLVIHGLRPYANSKMVDGVERFRVWAPTPDQVRMDQFSAGCQMASALYGIPSGGVAPRGAVLGYKKKWVTCTPVLRYSGPAQNPRAWVPGEGGESIACRYWLALFG